VSGGVFGGEVIVVQIVCEHKYSDHKLARQITSNFAPALVHAKHARETAVHLGTVSFSKPKLTARYSSPFTLICFTTSQDFLSSKL